jgi:hypothetical protein
MSEKFDEEGDGVLFESLRRIGSRDWLRRYRDLSIAELLHQTGFGNVVYFDNRIL